MTILVQQQLRKRASRATPGPWELQTSNSWRRIGTAGGRFADGDVLAPTTHRSDNHPDLAARQEDLDFIVAADPATVLALLDELDQLKAENAKLIGVVHAYEAARDSLFVQCLSNPIKNAWGKQVDVSLLNQAHEQAGKVIDACQRRREQAMTKEQP